MKSKLTAIVINMHKLSAETSVEPESICCVIISSRLRHTDTSDPKAVEVSNLNENQIKCF